MRLNTFRGILLSAGLLTAVAVSGVLVWAAKDPAPEPVVTEFISHDAPPDHIAHALDIDRHTGSMVINRPFRRMVFYIDVYRAGGKVGGCDFGNLGVGNNASSTFQGRKLEFAVHLVDLAHLPLAINPNSGPPKWRDVPQDQRTRVHTKLVVRNKGATTSTGNSLDLPKEIFDVSRSHGRTQFSEVQVPRQVGEQETVVPLFGVVAGEQGPTPIFGTFKMTQRDEEGRIVHERKTDNSRPTINEFVQAHFRSTMPEDRSVLVAYLVFE